MNQLFFDLIRVAIGAQASLNRFPSEAEWEELFEMAVKQSLIGVCFVGLNRLGADSENSSLRQTQGKQDSGQEDTFARIGMSEDLYFDWMGMAAQINMKNELVNQQCVELQRRLAADGIGSIILKGQGAATLYGEELRGFRQSGDIDAFVDCGREKAVAFVQSVAPTNEVNHKHVQLHCFSDTEVELHYIAAELHCPWHNKHLQRFFASHSETVKVKLNAAGEITVPCEAFNIVHLLTHAYRHMFGDGIGLRQVMDLYFALKTLSDSPLKGENIEEIKEVVREAGMGKFASAMMWVIKTVFIGHDTSTNTGADDANFFVWIPNEYDGQFLLDEIMMAGNFGKYDERIDRKGESRGHRFWRVTKQNWRLMRFSPWEVVCTPLWRIWHFCWMRSHGYTQG